MEFVHSAWRWESIVADGGSCLDVMPGGHFGPIAEFFR